MDMHKPIWSTFQTLPNPQLVGGYLVVLLEDPLAQLMTSDLFNV